LSWQRDKRVWLGAGVLALGVALWLAGPTDEEVAGIPTYQVARGQFQVTLVENGELQAGRAEKIAAPEVDGELKIVHLGPEGARVEVGELILQFDKTQFERDLKNVEGELEKARADLVRTQADHTQQLDDLRTTVSQQEAGLELSQLKLKQAEYGTPLEKEQAQINLAQAKRSLEQARKDSLARILVNQVEMSKVQLHISQMERNYERARANYERLSVLAPRPGILIYEKYRKRGSDRTEKVQVGDQPWGGQVLLSLPELADMKVVSQVGEMDVQRVRPGQAVLVRMEAFPGPVFQGKVAKVAPMANPEEDAPNVQVFELVVDLLDQDERLKPGMSASVEIVVETIANALSLPLEAVREVDGRTLVYRVRGQHLEPAEVVLGQRNAVAAVVDSGLEEGALLALRPPVPPKEQP
jgi:multidrug resistance efflux pump